MNGWITGFEHPAFLWAAAAVLPLLGLYWLYRRSKVMPVSAIFLWDRPETTPKSGSRWQLRRLPLSFFLEALALLLLAFAAAGPFHMSREAYPVLAVVLDNSFSMRAAPAGGVSPRDQGAAELRKLLEQYPGRRVLLIVAGNEPRLCSDSREMPDFERFWTADEPASDLAGALALARLRSAGCELLVMTDRIPDFPLAEDTGCFAAGTPLGNTALVNVRRGEETILAEALNASGEPKRVRLELSPGGAAETVELAPGERYKFVFRIPDTARGREIAVTLRPEEGEDPLPFDNHAVTLPENRAPLRFACAEDLPEAVVQELDAVLTGNPDFVRSSEPEIIFCGPGLAAGNYHRFIWYVPGEGRGRSDLEPVSARSGRVLTRGLALKDLRWSADPELRLPGEVLLQRGGTELLSFRRRMDLRSDIFLNLGPEASNLSRRPFWPAFFWNVAAYLRAERPGPGRTNFRSGEVIDFRVADPAVREVRVLCPDNSVRTVAPHRLRAMLADLPPGVSRIDAGGESWSVSVQPLSAAESQLEDAGTFRREPLHVAQMAENPRSPLGWIAFLLAAAVLAVHQYLLGSGRGGKK